MARFICTIKAGRAMNNFHIEAPNYNHVLAFCKTVFYAKVVEIKEVVYSSSSTPPVDDPSLYYGFMKCLISTGKEDEQSLLQMQYAFPFVKKTLKPSELENAFIKHITIAGRKTKVLSNLQRKNN